VHATNLTFDGNNATDGGSDISSRYVSAFYLQGSILSSNTALGICYEETGLHAAYVYDDGYNIIEDGTCITDPTSFAADPLLGTLQDNGGETFTQSLLESSPAIDAIPMGSCAVIEDQRGIARPQGNGCDIGAFEVEVAQAVRTIFLPLVEK